MCSSLADSYIHRLHTLALPGEKDCEITRDGRIIAVSHESSWKFTPARSGPHGYKKVRKRATMAILRCGNFAVDRTLACCFLVAEGFIACWIEPAPCWNRRRTYCWLGGNYRFQVETRVVKGCKIACCMWVCTNISYESTSLPSRVEYTCTYTQCIGKMPQRKPLHGNTPKMLALPLFNQYTKRTGCFKQPLASTSKLDSRFLP